MWQPDRTRLVKIRLHDHGEDPETVWAEDLGPAILHPAARYVRIANIPVLHTKPTFGDVVEVLVHGGGMPEWNRQGFDGHGIAARILEDGGRWLAIVDYWPSRRRSNVASTFRALAVAGEARDIAIEGLVASKNRGCACLAVPGSMSRADLVTWLEAQRASLGFELRHPEAGSSCG